MSALRFLRDVLVTIVITFAVVAVVTFLYRLIVHGSGSVSWETAFELSVVLGIVLPLMRRCDRG